MKIPSVWEFPLIWFEFLWQNKWRMYLNFLIWERKKRKLLKSFSVGVKPLFSRDGRDRVMMEAPSMRLLLVGGRWRKAGRGLWMYRCSMAGFQFIGSRSSVFFDIRFKKIRTKTKP